MLQRRRELKEDAAWHIEQKRRQEQWERAERKGEDTGGAAISN